MAGEVGGSTSMQKNQWLLIAGGASVTAIIALWAMRQLKQRKPRRVVVAVDCGSVGAPLTDALKIIEDSVGLRNEESFTSPLRVNLLDLECSSDRDVIAAETLMQMALKNTNSFQLNVRDVCVHLTNLSDEVPSEVLSIGTSIDQEGLTGLYHLQQTVAASVSQRKGIIVTLPVVDEHLPIVQYRTVGMGSTTEVEAFGRLKDLVAHGRRGPGRSKGGTIVDEDGDEAHEFWCAVDDGSFLRSDLGDPAPAEPAVRKDCGVVPAVEEVVSVGRIAVLSTDTQTGSQPDSGESVRSWLVLGKAGTGAWESSILSERGRDMAARQRSEPLFTEVTPES